MAVVKAMLLSNRTRQEMKEIELELKPFDFQYDLMVGMNSENKPIELLKDNEPFYKLSIYHDKLNNPFVIIARNRVELMEKFDIFMKSRAIFS